MKNNHIVQNKTNLVKRVASLYTYRSHQRLVSPRLLDSYLLLYLLCVSSHSCLNSTAWTLGIPRRGLGDLQGFLGYTLRTVGAEDKELFGIGFYVCVF